MKKLITLLITVLLLVGCSGKKNEMRPANPIPDTTSAKPAESETNEKFYGTWRTSGIFTNGTRLDMEQIEALETGKNFDMILVINKDGKFIVYSGNNNQIGDDEWTSGENDDSIKIGNTEIFMDNGELYINVDDEKLYLAKISDRQDRDYLDELLKKESEQEEAQPVEEPEPEQKEETVTENTIRPEVKEAIDAYESFIDEYCEFMTKYSESGGTDLKLIADYATFLGKLADYEYKMDKMADDLTDAEYWYYVEVLNRCNEKIMKAAS